jgi:His-Xaa-Ser repeat protein HxsA
MKGHFKKLATLVSLSLGQHTQAAVLVDPPSHPIVPDNLKVTDLNISVSQMLAAHRSHSSHASHSSHRSSSSGGSYRAPSPSYNPPSSGGGVYKSDPIGQKARPSSSYPSNIDSSTPESLRKNKKALKNVIMRMQLALQFEGYYDGQVDGVMGPKTREAVKKYKKAKGIPGSGVLDAQTLNALGIKGF